MPDAEKAATPPYPIDALLVDEPEYWTPDGTRAFVATAGYLAVDERVLVNRNHGTWCPSAPLNTERHSVWGRVAEKRAHGGFVYLTLDVDGESFPMTLRRGWPLSRQVPTVLTYAEMDSRQRRAHVVGLSNQVTIAMASYGAEMANHARDNHADAWERAQSWEAEAKAALRALTALIPSDVE